MLENQATAATQIRMQSEGLFLINLKNKSTLIKYINEFKKKTLCGNGVIYLEYGEQCGCGGASLWCQAVTVSST